MSSQSILSSRRQAERNTATRSCIAIEKDCGRFEWTVLDWNEPSIRFYEILGAKRHGEWLIYRLTGDNLARLATESRNKETENGG